VRPLGFEKPTLACTKIRKLPLILKTFMASHKFFFQFIPLPPKKPLKVKLLKQKKKTNKQRKKLHGIPYVLGTINGSHIPSIAPSWDPASYYCRKGFDSALLQRVVDAQCRLWENVIKACRLFLKIFFTSFQYAKCSFNYT
jgi:hypothetical protein